MRRTGLQIDKQEFNQFKWKYNEYLNKMRAEDYKKQIDERANDPKELFKVVNKALYKNQNNPMPPNKPNSELVDEFINYFDDKIKKIRINLDSSQNETYKFNEEIKKYTTELKDFKELSMNDVRNLLKATSNKYCELDPIPTELLKECTEELLPLITKIVNLSMSLGDMPEELKEAIIKPLLKKLGLELIDKNYRPVSNLSFISKLIERAVALQLIEHLKENDLYDEFQSAYRQFHSTETALLRARNDILMEMDEHKVVLLLLLDLSAAFDTIDHDILLNRLKKRCGITGTVLKWFSSYLTNRKQFVRIGESDSEKRELLYGVPQGSVLGPILFCIYMSPLGEMIEKEGMDRQEYADDAGLYTSFLPKNNESKQAMIIRVKKCLSIVRKFLHKNKLKVNDDKTVLMILGSAYWLSYVDFDTVNVGSAEVKTVDSTRNLGVIFDKEMNMEEHIKNICKRGYLHIKNLFYLSRFLDKTHRNIVAHALLHPLLITVTHCCMDYQMNR